MATYNITLQDLNDAARGKPHCQIPDLAVPGEDVTLIRNDRGTGRDYGGRIAFDPRLGVYLDAWFPEGEPLEFEPGDTFFRRKDESRETPYVIHCITG